MALDWLETQYISPTGSVLNRITNMAYLLLSRGTTVTCLRMSEAS